MVEGAFPRLQLTHLGHTTSQDFLHFEVTLLPEADRPSFNAALASGAVKTTGQWLATGNRPATVFAAAKPTALRPSDQEGRRPDSQRLSRQISEERIARLLAEASNLPWKTRLERAVQNDLRNWLGSAPTVDLAEVPPPIFPSALSIKQEPWETNREFEERVDRARNDRRQTIDRLQAEYRIRVEERNRRVAEYSRANQERQASLPQRRRELVLVGLGILAPTLTVSNAALDQQSGALTVSAQVDGLAAQTFAFTGTPQDFRRMALTDLRALRAKPEFEVSDAGEISLRAVLLESSNASARGLPSEVAVSPIQLATVTLPQAEPVSFAQQSAATVDRNQVEQILYREENQALRRRLEEQRRQQEQAIASAEARAAAEIARIRAESEVLLNEPRVSRAGREQVEASIRSGRRKALVVGNDNYTRVPRLVAARADAQAIASTLRTLGFRVHEHLDLTERSMKQALREFKTAVQAGDEVVFFFAGHGVDIDGRNYLLPTDIQNESEYQVRDEGLLLQRVLDDIQERGASFTLAVIDACRDNPFRSVGRAIGGRGLAPTVAATGQMIIFSAGTGQQALDRLAPSDPDRNGVFTRVFLREMIKPGLPVDRVLRNVRQEVVRLAQSVGREQTPALYDQAVGDFVFKP